jgi:ABC-2 type transport system ATP-binding protein
MQHALVLEKVRKQYQGHVAVRSLDLAVPAGSIYGILGPNGAGKSTTIRMALNIIACDQGRVSLLGSNPAQHREVLRRVGYLPEERGLYRRMTVTEVIVFFARLKGMSLAAARAEADRWIERMGLTDWRRSRIETLSKGMQQKVQFIATVSHHPELLVLDEPASGLDPVNQEVLRETILDAKREGRTVILSTHNMEHAEQLCDAVCIIAGGEKVLDGSLDEVRRAHRDQRFAVSFEGPSESAEKFLRTRQGPFISAVRKRDGWEFELAPGTSTHEALASLNALDVGIERFARVQPSLHEIFIRRVGRSAAPARRPEPAHA